MWNISPRGIGVELNKLVGNRILAKRIHVCIEHVRPSKAVERGATAALIAMFTSSNTATNAAARRLALAALLPHTGDAADVRLDVE